MIITLTAGDVTATLSPGHFVIVDKQDRRTVPTAANAMLALSAGIRDGSVVEYLTTTGGRERHNILNLSTVQHVREG